MQAMKFGVGQPVKRVEDVRLVKGQGAFASDYSPEGALHAVFLRSPHAHAKFAVTDIEAARALPGVRGVFVASDFAALGGLPCLATMNNSDGSLTPAEALSGDGRRRRAACRRHRRDGRGGHALAGARRRRGDRRRLGGPCRRSSTWRRRSKTALLRSIAGAPGNLAYDHEIGDKAKTDAVFARAAHVVRVKVVNPRVVANFLETRAAVAEYDSAERPPDAACGKPGRPRHSEDRSPAISSRSRRTKLRVTTNDVGGGFGTKTFVYREYPLVLEAAKRLGRPVVWRADRSEHFVGDAQGRDNVTVAEMALDEAGRFLALRVDILGNLGAYLSQFAPYIPWLGATMATGPYDIGALHARVRGVYTHTVPVDAYRGAGRPEAAYVLERLVDRCARALGAARPRRSARAISSRRRRCPTGRRPTAPTTSATSKGRSGPASPRPTMRASAGARRSRARAASSGASACRATSNAPPGTTPRRAPSSSNSRATSPSSSARSRTGRAMRRPTPRWSREYLDVPLSRVKVVQGDTDRVASGAGTGARGRFRSAPSWSTARRASSPPSLKDLAADKLEASARDLEIVDGRIRIAGTDRSISYEELAALPAATAEKRTAIESFTPPQATYPNGTHICEVEIDPETGRTRIVRYTVVDDFGVTLNPLLLEGQVHGGIAQGAGQALMEGAVYDEDGQLLTASLMDYCLPRADDLPNFAFETRNVPSTTNPMGLKGAGEAGTIGSTPAVMNAVGDALWRAYGIDHIDMPATPFAVFKAIRSRGAGG